MVNLLCILVLCCQETDEEADCHALRGKCLIPVCVGPDWSRQEKQLKETCSAQVSALWKSDEVALNEKLIKWGIKFLPFPSLGEKQLQAVCAVWIDEKTDWILCRWAAPILSLPKYWILRIYPGCKWLSTCVFHRQGGYGAAINVLLFFLINLFPCARKEAFATSGLFLLQKAYWRIRKGAGESNW